MATFISEDRGRMTEDRKQNLRKKCCAPDFPMGIYFKKQIKQRELT